MEQNWKELALEASRKLNRVSNDEINSVLLDVADAAEAASFLLLKANEQDLAKMEKSNPLYDRLMLTEERIKGIAADMRKVASLPSPLNRVLEERTLPNGLHLTKRSVPFGVIGIIYEARPNVSFDVFSLCLKSGNVCVLKGGTDAYNSNFAIVELIKGVLEAHDLDSNIIHLMPAGREATAELMDAVGYVDLIIAEGTAIIANAKTRRVSVCNALDTLIINSKRLSDLPEICKPLAEKNVVIEADPKAYTFLMGKYPDNLLEKANESTFGKEFMDYRMGLKTVESLDEALEHIARYSSKHSECIITENESSAAKFQKEVDAACVYVNAPTSFTDGAQFGMGAEIGISTQKLHARGPMALPELTTYKWLINGNGQIRS